jgi:hypothetical protein
MPLYSAYGFTLDSELELSGLPCAGGRSAAGTVTIRRGEVAWPRASRGDWSADERRIRVFRAGAGLAAVRVPGVARFLIAGAREIVVDPVPRAAASRVRSYLLGSVFAVLLLDRGILPLHASAVSIDGRCVAFTAAQGSGKSTLAAHLAARGVPLVADDVLAVEVDPARGRRPLARPGVSRLKLDLQALESLGEVRAGCAAASASPPAAAPHEKREWLAPRPCGEAMPLGALLVLARRGGCPAAAPRIEIPPASPELRPLGGARRIEAIVRATHRVRFVRELGLEARHFSQCEALARDVLVGELHYDSGWEPLRDLARRLASGEIAAGEALSSAPRSAAART